MDTSSPTPLERLFGLVDRLQTGRLLHYKSARVKTQSMPQDLPLCPLRSDDDLDPLLKKGEELAKTLPSKYTWLQVQNYVGQWSS